jgi:hypothetical protein
MAMTAETERGSAERLDGRHPAGWTRAQALRAAALGGAVLGGGVLAGGWAGPEVSTGRPSRGQDVRIFNFLLVLEELQVAFYDTALRRGALRGDLLRFARTVAPQEREHAAFLRNALGREARAVPKLDVRDATSDSARFRAAAIDLEETTAAGYIGQGGSLTRAAMQDAARIVAAEARHAAWIRDIAGTDPAPRAADPARSADDILADLRRKGFLR